MRFATLESGLRVDLYQLTMGQCYFFDRRGQWATFEVFIRQKRKNRPFYIACGIERVLETVKDFGFSKKDIDYLESLGMFRREFLEYLKKFKFSGYVWAVEEGEIVFPEEPFLRVVASIIEAQIIESAVLNTINLYTTLATKAARVVLSSGGKKVYDFSLRRTQGIEASLACAYCSYLCGAEATSNVLAGMLYGVPVVGTMAHSFVQSFSHEYDAFLSFARHFPKSSALLVDTYDIPGGLRHTAKIARVLEKEGYSLLGIRIDSGNLIQEAGKARRFLDKKGLKNVKIILSGNLDEYKISEIISKKAPVDGFGVGTLMGTSADMPYTDVIYKLTEITNRNGEFIPIMKLSSKKLVFPGRKQVYRIHSGGSRLKRDIVGLEEEKVSSCSLLSLKMEKGQIVAERSSLETLKKKVSGNLRRLPAYIKKPETQRFYPVQFSRGVKKVFTRIKKDIFKRNSLYADVVFFDVDTQNDFMLRNGGLYVRNADKIIPAVKRLTRMARSMNIRIFSSADAHPRKHKEFEVFGPHCVKGTWGQEKTAGSILPEHRIIPYRKKLGEDEIFGIFLEYPQIVLEKSDLDVFTNPNTQEFLKYVNFAFVYGVVTEFCVKCAVEGLLERGVKVFLIKDAIKEIDRRKKKSLFKYWKRKGVKIINLSAVKKNLARI